MSPSLIETLLEVAFITGNLVWAKDKEVRNIKDKKAKFFIWIFPVKIRNSNKKTSVRSLLVTTPTEAKGIALQFRLHTRLKNFKPVGNAERFKRLPQHFACFSIM